ncbi:MAG: hypothetical protein A2046_02695 [Bacteroidetes bacterium GWA2_30_7]|nr:MAG: hypothetical protein A2046_02695 [Bacteroidetes bacterium GWA2_30_7]
MENIELRSEKVRNIIGQIPPAIIRIGISVIFTIFICLIIGSYFFEYTPTIKTTAIIKTQNNQNFITLKIPANEIKKVKTGQTVIINFDNIPALYNLKIFGKITTINNDLEIDKTGGYYNSNIELPEKSFSKNANKISINTQISVNAEIQTTKTNLFKRIIEPFQYLTF